MKNSYFWGYVPVDHKFWEAEARRREEERIEAERREEEVETLDPNMYPWEASY